MSAATQMQVDGLTQWIGGRAIPTSAESVFARFDPSDETLVAEVTRGCAAEADAAVGAARAAQREWARLSPTARGELLHQGARRLQDEREPVSELLVRETGKPIESARAELGLTLDWIESIVQTGIHQSGRSVPAGAGELLFQHVSPHGVAVCLNTWNAPVIAGIEMAVANLIVGNTVVLKTSERAPLATRLACERAFDHLPSGVLNVVAGDGPNMGEPLVQHAQTDLVCFIGSVNVGRRVGEAAGRRLRKAVLELGGKDALIIDETVDVKAAARFAAPSCFANSGQICTSTERIYVQRSVHDAFVEELARIAEAMVVGPGRDPRTQMGPMIDADIRDHVEQQVQQAVQQGAVALTGGRRLARKGYFFPPTVLTGVSDDVELMVEETFGPVAPVVAVDSFDEAIDRANRSEFGLSAIVLTESAPRAFQAIENLTCGMVRINTMRGQVPHCCAEPAKNSGLAFGHGPEFLDELTYRKAVRWRSTLPA